MKIQVSVLKDTGDQQALLSKWKGFLPGPSPGQVPRFQCLRKPPTPPVCDSLDLTVPKAKLLASSLKPSSVFFHTQKLLVPGAKLQQHSSASETLHGWSAGKVSRKPDPQVGLGDLQPSSSSWGTFSRSSSHYLLTLLSFSTTTAPRTGASTVFLCKMLLFS